MKRNLKTSLFFLLFLYHLSFSHNLIEKTEEHLYLKTSYLDFHNSVIKKFGYMSNIKYGLFLNKQHNFIFDYKHIDVQTKFNKTLKVRKYSLGYQYIFNKKRLIFNYIYINDNLSEPVDDVRVYGIGLGYKNFEIKQYYECFKNFNVYETDFKYFLPTAYLKSLFIFKYIHIDKNNSLPNNIEKNYFPLGIIAHKSIKGLHIGLGGFIGKRIFTVMDNGTDLQHHPLEFKYTIFFKIGKKFKYGIFHMGIAQSKADELPRNNRNVKITNFFIDYSIRF